MLKPLPFLLFYLRPSTNTPNQSTACQVFPAPLGNSAFHEIEVRLFRLTRRSAKISKDIFHILPRSLFLAHQRTVPAIGVFIQFFDSWHNTGTNGIEVNIANKLLQVCIFLTDDGFVSILKKLAVAFVATVKADSVSRKEPSHYRGKGRESCSKEEMGMFWDEHPCVTDSFSLR